MPPPPPTTNYIINQPDPTFTTWHSSVILENVCETYGPSACLFGECTSIIITNTSHQQQCVCKEGFVHDTMWLKQQNCGMPYWFLSFHCGLQTFFGIVCLIVAFQYFRTGLRAGSRRTVQFVVGAALCHMIFGIAHWILGYPNRIMFFFNAGFQIFIALAMASFSDMIWNVTMSTLQVSSTTMESEEQTSNTANTNNKSQPVVVEVAVVNITTLIKRVQLIRYLFIGSFALLPLTGIANAIGQFSLGDETNSNYDALASNTLAAISIIIFPLHNLIYFPTYMYLARQLTRILNHSIENEARMSRKNADGTISEGSRLREARNRIQRFTFIAGGIMAPAEILILTVLISILWVYRIPGFWLVFLFISGFATAATTLVLVTVKSRIRKMKETIGPMSGSNTTKERAGSKDGGGKNNKVVGYNNNNVVAVGGSISSVVVADPS
jgi:hypothetical protein